MTEPNDHQPAFDDAPTTPTQQTPYPPTPYPPTSAAPIPPRGPQAAAPTAWQPAGWSGAQESEPITWTPAGQEPVAPKRRGRGRWIVALLAALLVVVAAVGVAVFAVGSKSNAAVGPTFLPQSTPLYVEARLDLPGSQRDNVIKLVTHFPGFADPSAFDSEVDKAFDKLVGNVTSDKITYTGDVKPWFGGQIAIGLLQVPASMSGSMMSSGTMTPGGLAADAAQVHLVAGISIKDRSKLDTLLTTLRALPSGITFSPEQYGDHTVVTATRNAKALAAYSLSDTLLLIAADPQDLKTSLDVLDGKQPSLAADAGFTSAMKDLPRERLGAVYLGPALYQSAADSMTTLQDTLGGASGMSAAALRCVMPSVSDPANAHAAAAIVANGDSVAFQSTSKGLPAMPTRTATDLAAHMPADAFFYAEVPKVGGSLHDLIACLRTAMPDAFAGAQVKQIEKLLGTNLEDYLSFVTDVGISVTYDGSKFHWGLVASVDNVDTANSRVTDIVTAAKLTARLGQAPFSVSEQQTSGATVTTITFTDAAGLGNVPIDPSVSLALNGGHLYLGGGDFAASAISRTAADSLASSERYSSALSAAGNPNGVTLYLDIDAVRQRVEAASGLNGGGAAAGSISGQFAQNYVTNMQPYLKPFDRLIIGSNQDAGTLTGRVVLFVK